MTDPTDVPNSGGPTAAGSAASRRTVLRAAGLVTLVGGSGAALAACSSDPSSGAAPASSAPASGEPSSAAPTSASPTAAESSSAPAQTESTKTSASAKAPSGPSVTKADVPDGGGFILPNADYVVTQPARGTYKAFSKICTHQGCAVSSIVNKEIVCKCHNSHFSIEDGSVISGPADAPLPSAKTTVAGDKIVIST